MCGRDSDGIGVLRLQCNLKLRTVRTTTVAPTSPSLLLGLGNADLTAPPRRAYGHRPGCSPWLSAQPGSFDRAAVLVAQWCDLQLETRVRTLPRVRNGHVTTQMLTSRVATEMLSTGANGQKEDAASLFCQRRFDRAVRWARGGPRRPAPWAGPRRGRMQAAASEPGLAQRGAVCPAGTDSCKRDTKM